MRFYDKFFIIFLVFSISLFIGVGLVHSTSNSQISASVNWANFSISLGDSPLPDTSTSYFDQRSTSLANAGYNDAMGGVVDSGYKSPWSEPTYAKKSITNATGMAQTASEKLQATADVTADGVTNYYARATSMMYRIGYFFSTPGSTLDISVPFAVEFTFDYNPVLDVVGAWIDYGIQVYNIDSGGNSTGIASSTYNFTKYGYNGAPEDLNNEVWIPDPEFLTRSISITLPTSKYREGYGYEYGIDIFINTSAFAGVQKPVPEPTTILLLGSGLIGLIGIRRKRRE